MFDDVIVVSRERSLATADEVEALERELGVTMPPAYAEFVTTLGEGTYGDSLQIKLPGRILVLPRDFDDVVDAGGTVEDLLTWYDTAGLVTPPTRVHWFTSWAGRTTHQNWPGGDPDLIRSGLLELGLHAAHEDHEDGSSRFIIPTIGGHALLTRGDWGCNVSLRFDSDLGDRVTPLAHVLEEAGAGRGVPRDQDG